MAQKVKKFFHNLSVQNKFLLSYLFICFICFFAIFFIAIPQLSQKTEDNLTYSASQALSQSTEYLSFQIDSVLQHIYSVGYNKTVLEILSRSYESLDINTQLIDKQKLDSIIQTTLVTHVKTLSGATLYVNDDFSYSTERSSLYRTFSSLEDAPWYTDMRNIKQAYYCIPPSQNIKPNVLSVIRMISSPTDYSRFIGALAFDIPFTSIENILEKCAVTPNSYAYIINDAGVLVCASSNTPSIADLLTHEVTGFSDNSHSDYNYIYSIQRLEDYGWTLVQALSKQDIQIIRFNELKALIIACIFIIIICILTSLRVSSSITRRISTLSNAMRSFYFDNPTPLLVENDGDDIDSLIKSYNDLIFRLEDLTKENDIKQHLLSETELALLHSQIKPHFLYNTLDMIRSLSERGDSQTAARAIKALSRFYRSGLGNRTLWSTLEVELNHVRSYVEIQQLRYGNQIQLDVNVDPIYYDINLPRITLQPFVENSLIHGILSQGRSGTISIYITDITEDMLSIIIKDNGKGMPRESVSHLFESGHFGTGIGLWNTNKRLLLHYNGKYELSADSRVNEFTTISIRIPIMRGKEKVEYEFTNC